MAPQPFTWRSFYERMNDVDPDLRQMALFDLQQELSKDALQLGNEEDKCARVVLKCFSPAESNSEVHSNAIRLLSVMVPKLEKRSRDMVLSQLSKYMHATDIPNDKVRAIRDNASLALKGTINAISSKQADSALAIATDLVPGLNSTDLKVRTEVFDVLAELVKRFGTGIEPTHKTIVEAGLRDLDNNTMLRKRATTCLAAACGVCSEELFVQVMSFTLDGLQKQRGERLRRYIQVCTAISRAAGSRFSSWVDRVGPLLLGELDRLATIEDDEERESPEADETRENILQALENVTSRCPNFVTPLLPEIVARASALLSWDPNYCDDVEDEFEDDDEDLEDDDDSSWKVRKSAGRCLVQVIRSRPDCLTLMLNTLVNQTQPLLVQRFNERVENVRLEVLDLFRALVKACSMESVVAAAAASVGSTQLGSFQLLEQSAMRAEAAPLLAIKDSIVRGLVRSAKHKSAKVKLAVYVILREVFTLMGRELGATVGDCATITVAHLKDARLALPHLRPDVLGFARVLVSVALALVTTSEKYEGLGAAIMPLVGVCATCAEEKYYRTVVAALKVLTECVPLIRVSADPNKVAVSIFDPLFNRLATTDADQEVRKAAMDGVAKVLKFAEKQVAATQGDKVRQAFDHILQLLRTETTRVASARAVHTMQRVNFPAPVVKAYAEELTGFLRKTDRQVREEGLRTLASFVGAHGKDVEPATYQSIVHELANGSANLLSDRELYLTALALQLGRVVAAVPGQCDAVEKTVVPHVISLLGSALTQGAAVNEAATLLDCVARGSSNYSTLLNNVFVAVKKAAAGASLVNLTHALGVVAGADKDGKMLKATASELIKMAGAGKPGATAGIMGLGELGRYADLGALGASATLSTHITNTDEELRTTAVYALGRAASRDAGAATFTMLVANVKPGEHVTLHLRALKEAFLAILTDGAVPNVVQKERAALLNALLEVAKSDADTVADATAECLGRFTQVDPSLIAELASKVGSLTDDQRATTLSAMRFTMTNYSSSQLDDAVRQHLEAFLQYLCKNQPLRVRRGAVQLFMAAGYNRPGFILTEAVRTRVFPNLLAETEVDKTLITTIDLGPFKHTVDKGLELRKQAFECLANLVDGLSRPHSVLEAVDQFDTVVKRLGASLKEPETDLDVFASARTTLVKLTRHAAAAAAVGANIELLATNLKAMVALKPKDGQDKDKIEDAARGAIVCALKMAQQMPGASSDPKFAELMTACQAHKSFADAQAAAADM